MAWTIWSDKWREPQPEVWIPRMGERICMIKIKSDHRFMVHTVDHGSVFPLSLHRATQLDIDASFHLDPLDVVTVKQADVGYNCSTSGGTT